MALRSAIRELQGLPASGKRLPARWMRVTVAVMSVLLMTGAMLATVHILFVHRDSHEWAWTPSALAPQIHFVGRDYERGSATVSVDHGRTAQGSLLGHSAGGGLIVGHPAVDGLVPTVVIVIDGNRAATCALSGGP